MQQTPRAAKISPIPQLVLDLAVVLIILLVGWVYTHGIEQTIDIGLYDESVYLYRGLHIPDGFPSAQNAPLYALWYYILSFLEPDSLQLYFFNYKLMTVLPPLMLFVTLRTYNVSRILSFVVSSGFLFSFANFPTWPKVSHFALVVLLCGFALSSFVRDRRLQACALVIAALLASYVRPEYFLTFICLGVVLVFVTLVALRSTRSLRSAIPLIVTLIPGLIFILWLGLPMEEGNRGMVAFGQHYARNWVSWHNDERNPWTNWETIVTGDFGDIDSPREALLSNPSAVARHIVHNLRSCPGELKTMFVSTLPSSRPADIALPLGMLVMVAAGMAHVRRHRIAALRDRLAENWMCLRFRVVLFLIVLLPVAVSVLLIAPRRHHLYLLGALLAFGLAILLFRNTERSTGHSSYSVIALLCVMLLLTTRPLSNSMGKPSQPNLSTINFLRSLDITVPIDILEAEGGYGFYISGNYNRVAEYDKRTPFGDFLAERSIDMIVVSDRLAQDVRFRDDPEWHSFTKDPSQFGFMQVTMPGVEKRSLFVSREIIEAK
jgi:hypothetical protein